jgi:branched-chain amino acid transport system substrate-binding protein
MMRARRGTWIARPAAVLPAVALAVGVAVGACGQEQRPVRVGVVVDCVGIYRPLEGAELAGAELPLVQRGAEIHRSGPLGGVSAARISGRRVEMVRGCTEVLEFSTLTAEMRRLVEHEHVDVVVAGTSGVDELVMREVARRYPRVVFVAVVPGPRDVTTRRPAANLYRAAADHGQGVAGLGTYAYRRLGWRSAAVVTGDWDVGWGGRDAFVSEFCALGGRVTSQFARAPFDARGADVERVPRDVDGVAVFAPALFSPARFLQRLAGRLGSPARRMLVGPSVVDDPDLLRATRRALAGVVGSSAVSARERSPALRRYLRAMARAFPGVASDTARGQLVRGYRDAVELVARGLERAGGDPARLPRALAGLRIDLVGGPVRLDQNRQAVVTTALVRIGGRPGGGGDAGLTPVGSAAAVDQSVGGLLAPSLATRFGPTPCRRAAPPPWSR